MQAAGDYKRVKSSGVSHLLTQHVVGDAYGPSQKAYSSWKRSGEPMSNANLSVQQTNFGRATAKMETSKNIIYGDPTEAAAPVVAPRPVSSKSVNPITWEGAPPEPPPRRPVEDIHNSVPPAAAPAPPRNKQRALTPEQQQQKWGQLMRSGHVSAAQCLVVRPSRPPSLQRSLTFSTHAAGSHGTTCAPVCFHACRLRVACRPYRPSTLGSLRKTRRRGRRLRSECLTLALRRRTQVRSAHQLRSASFQSAPELCTMHFPSSACCKSV
eukprot:1509201-Pleurochrysis_carterae.AAC.2